MPACSACVYLIFLVQSASMNKKNLSLFVALYYPGAHENLYCCTSCRCPAQLLPSSALGTSLRRGVLAELL